MQSNSIKICEICEKDFVPVPANTSSVCDECIAREPKRETEVEDELQDHTEMCHKGFELKSDIKEEHEFKQIIENDTCIYIKQDYSENHLLCAENNEDTFTLENNQEICHNSNELKSELQEEHEATHSNEIPCLHEICEDFKAQNDSHIYSKQVCSENSLLCSGSNEDTFIQENNLICNKDFSFANELKQHESLCVTEKYECDICKETFKQKISLSVHILVEHEEMCFECNICGKRFKCKENLSEHKAAAHSDEMRYSCDKCDKCYKHLRYLFFHIREHHEDLICTVCNKLFLFAKDRRQHELSCVNQYECGIWKTTFEEKACINQHIRETHEVERFTCNKCYKNFCSAKNLQQHELVCGNATYECDTCKQTFKTKYNLRRHREKQHEGKCFMCKICYNRFSFASELEQHVSLCIKKKYECDICNETFNWKRSLRNHIIKHEEKRFTCKLCNKSFYLAKHLQQHESLCVNKQYECDICKNRFKLKSSLGLHRFQHEEKRFTCNICYKSFTYKCVLKEHESTHSNERPYACDKCDVRVKYKSSLRAHIKRKHGENNKLCV